VPVRRLTHVRFLANRRRTMRAQLLAHLAGWLDVYSDPESLRREAKLATQASLNLKNIRQSIAGAHTSEKRAQAAAAAVRRAAKIENEVVWDICGFLEDSGVKVFTPTLASESFFGLSVADQDGGPAVVVNTWERLSVERWV